MVKLTDQVKDLNLPALYETDGDENALFIRLSLGETGFEWFLKEYDPIAKEGFGYANLNDPQMAELGYVSITELETLPRDSIIARISGLEVTIDKDFKPSTIAEIKNELLNY